MAASQQPSDSGEQRVRCLYCGANNFAGSVSCWQCARTLVALREPQASPGGPVPSPAAPGFAPPSPARPTGFAALGPLAMNTAASASRAKKSAVLLALLMPWFGLPVGMVFLMLDDDRKAELGWIMIWWSVGSLVLNIIGGIILSGILMSGLHALIPSGPLRNPAGGSSTPSLPDLGDGIILPAARVLLACYFSALG